MTISTMRNAIILTMLTAVAGCAARNPGPPPELISTDQGGAVTLSASMEKAAEWTAEAFQELGIRLKEVEVEADARGYLGMHKALRIRAELTRAADGRTAVKVSALKPAAASDTELARRLAQKIASKQD